MFINDNGDFGGQTIEILLDCECGDTIFLYSYRGNVPKMYVKPNCISHRDPKKSLTNLKQQRIW